MKESINTETVVRQYEVTNCQKLNVRKGPSKASPVVTVVDAGTVLDQESKPSNGWVKVRMNDIVGYVMTDYVV